MCLSEFQEEYMRDKNKGESRKKKTRGRIENKRIGIREEKEKRREDYVKKIRVKFYNVRFYFFSFFF